MCNWGQVPNYCVLCNLKKWGQALFFCVILGSWFCITSYCNWGQGVGVGESEADSGLNLVYLFVWSLAPLKQVYQIKAGNLRSGWGQASN